MQTFFIYELALQMPVCVSTKAVYTNENRKVVPENRIEKWRVLSQNKVSHREL